MCSPWEEAFNLTPSVKSPPKPTDWVSISEDITSKHSQCWFLTRSWNIYIYLAEAVIQSDVHFFQIIIGATGLKRYAQKPKSKIPQGLEPAAFSWQGLNLNPQSHIPSHNTEADQQVSVLQGNQHIQWIRNAHYMHYILHQEVNFTILIFFFFR